ncbi:MAG: hypothetical protein A2511_00600 [Deltaproteobacteria bacterium RIFOXYD12_FULL_50_9]|nr:MAG: hypothetical protein A2511_00600 [Deltaproteobacteria bacterium RIFOXYD12_FULL_50_9]
MTADSGNKCRNFLLLMMLFLLASACAIHRQSDKEDPAPRVQKIVVLPIIIAPADNSKPAPQTAVNRLKEGAATFTLLLAEYFKERPSVTILDEAQHEGLAADLTGDPEILARTIAGKNKADAVLLCTINRFVEREGGSYASAQPASVSFNFRLLGVESGVTLCDGSFDETQHPLSDNLFNIHIAASRGFKWITAQDLLKEGILKKFKECPELADQ